MQLLPGVPSKPQNINRLVSMVAMQCNVFSGLRPSKIKSACTHEGMHIISLPRKRVTVHTPKSLANYKNRVTIFPAMDYDETQISSEPK